MANTQRTTSTRDTVAEADQAVTAPVTVMLVDDEDLYLSSFRRLLRRLGYAIQAFSNPKDALQRFEERPEVPGLIVTDYRMPEMNGLELATRMHETRPNLPVLLCSGYSSELGEDQLRAAGIRQVLSKPVTADEFRAVVNEVLRARTG